MQEPTPIETLWEKSNSNESEIWRLKISKGDSLHFEVRYEKNGANIINYTDKSANVSQIQNILQHMIAGTSAGSPLCTEFRDAVLEFLTILN
jgi:hypothetical protein